MGRLSTKIRTRPALYSALNGVLFLLVAMYAYGDAPVYRITLDEEKALVAGIVAPARDRGSVVSFGAEEIYVLSERRSPQPFLRLDRFAPFLPLIGLDGCAAMMRRTLRERPAMVVVERRRYPQNCEREIGIQLSDGGYEIQATIKFRFGIVTWEVFRPAGSAGAAAP